MDNNPANILDISLIVSNALAVPVTDFVFQAAVPKVGQYQDVGVPPSPYTPHLVKVWRSTLSPIKSNPWCMFCTPNSTCVFYLACYSNTSTVVLLNSLPLGVRELNSFKLKGVLNGNHFM